MTGIGSVFWHDWIPKGLMTRTSEVIGIKMVGLTDGMLGDEMEENDGGPLEMKDRKFGLE